MRKFFFIVLTLCSVSAYADVQVHDGLVTADLQSQPLTQVLDRLKAQTDVHVFIDDGVQGKTISARFQDLTVAMALKKMLEGTGINYAVLGGENGEPKSIFIGASSRLGAAPKKLDNRPVNSRGVVNPVNPSTPVPPQPQETRPMPENRGYNPNTSVPTGGGFVPPSQQTQPPQDPQQQQQPDQQDDNSDNNEN
jgi:hypothetical protein